MSDTCVCYLDERLPPADASTYNVFAAILSTEVLLVIWTIFNYCTLYYGKTSVNLLTFRPFYWAAGALSVKMASTLLVFFKLPFFNCLVTKCPDLEWRQDPWFLAYRFL